VDPSVDPPPLRRAGRGRRRSWLPDSTVRRSATATTASRAREGVIRGDGVCRRGRFSRRHPARANAAHEVHIADFGRANRDECWEGDRGQNRVDPRFEERPRQVGPSRGPRRVRGERIRDAARRRHLGHVQRPEGARATSPADDRPGAENRSGLSRQEFRRGARGRVHPGGRNTRLGAVRQTRRGGPAGRQDARVRSLPAEISQVNQAVQPHHLRGSQKANPAGRYSRQTGSPEKVPMEKHGPQQPRP